MRAPLRPVLAAAAVAAAAVALPAPPAGAARHRAGESSGLTLRYPSGVLPDAASLNAAIRDPSVGTIVFERGTNPFTASINVFRRTGLTLRGATGRADDVVLETSSTVAVQIEEASGITLRDLTIRSTAANGEGVRLQAVRSSSIAGFAHDVTVLKCRVEAFVPLRGTVRARAFEVTDCRVDVTRAGGAGILWEDGSDLLVTRTKFTVSAPSSAVGAVVVRGALVAESEGDRARRIVLTNNSVSGDYKTAFDLSDLVDARIRRNTVTFSSATYPDTAGDSGRAGIVVRRVSASALTEDVEVRRNRVRGAHTAVWFLNTGGAGVVSGNDLRRSGTASADARFGDTGCALRVGLLGPFCRLVVQSNDLRELRSQAGTPASLITPAQGADTCFPEGSKNRVDRGRTVY